MMSALVLAAGLSRRMGTNKLLLPFGERTILGQVVAVLQACELAEIVVVTGHERQKIQEILGRPVGRHPYDGHSGLRFVHNPNYADGEMLSSIQAGLAAMRDDCQAALIVLGDQPRIERRIVDQVIAAHASGAVIIPSFNRHGGHPILIDRACWPSILALPSGTDLRHAWHAHADWMRYVDVDTDTILRDVDTLEDYNELTP